MEERHILTSGVVHRLLIAVLEKEDVAASLGYRLQINYAHLSMVIKLLEKENLIKRVKINHKANRVMLTESGKKLAIFLRNAYKVLENVKGGKNESKINSNTKHINRDTSDKHSQCNTNQKL